MVKQKNELHEELNAFLFKYSTSKPETLGKVLELLNYAKDRVYPDDDFNFEWEVNQLDTQNPDYIRQLDLLREKRDNLAPLRKLLDLIDNICQAVENPLHPIPQKELKAYWENY
jgi:hypothetical protein